CHQYLRAPEVRVASGSPPRKPVLGGRNDLATRSAALTVLPRYWYRLEAIAPSSESDCSHPSAHSPGSVVTITAAGATNNAPSALPTSVPTLRYASIRFLGSSFVPTTAT